MLGDGVEWACQTHRPLQAHLRPVLRFSELRTFDLGNVNKPLNSLFSTTDMFLSGLVLS